MGLAETVIPGFYKERVKLLISFLYCHSFARTYLKGRRGLPKKVGRCRSVAS